MIGIRKAYARKWAWKKIRELCDSTNKDAATVRILCLVDNDCKDYIVAEKEGFSINNIIGVNRDEYIVDSIQQKGYNCMCGSFENVIYHWPSNYKIDIVFADMCCGLTEVSLKLGTAIKKSLGLSKKTIIYTNFLRGRDPHTNSLRKKISKFLTKELFLNRSCMFNHILSSKSYNDYLIGVSDVGRSQYRIPFLNFNISHEEYHSYRSMSGNLPMDSSVYVLEPSKTKRTNKLLINFGTELEIANAINISENY